MPDFLLEFGVEEIPAGYIQPALEQGKAFLTAQLKEKRLDHTGITACATPRRLVFHIKDLLPKQADINKEILGPSVSIAFDNDNKPTPALYGFAKKNNLQPADVKVKDTPKGKVCYIQVTVNGEKTETILSAGIPLLIAALPWPKSMWWLDKSLTFARPLRYIMAIFGNKPFRCASPNGEKINMADITCSSKTYVGHLAPKPIMIKSADLSKYQAALKKAKVIVDQSERKNIIAQGIHDIAVKYDAACNEPELLDEVTNLVESPYMLECEFNESYLSLPDPVITSAMKSHQRYFPLRDKSGKLMSRFVVVSNNPHTKKPALIQEGNERVLRARLADASFFREQDRKTPLDEYAKRLNTIAFLGKLGTMAEKSERLKELGRFIASELKYEVSDTISRAAQLCKADLLTGMVGEFPDLQGIMGYEYLKDKEPEAALAIKEHYQPRFAGDKLPESKTGICLSLAEKFDTLVAAFSLALKPTGSNDPYGLRRQAIAILKIIIDKKLNISIDKIWEETIKLLVTSLRSYASEIAKSPYTGVKEFWSTVAKTGVPSDADIKSDSDEFNGFIEQRFYQMLVEEEGINSHIYGAVVNQKSLLDNILNAHTKIKTLQELSQTPIWDELVEVVERTHNISKSPLAIGEVNEELLKEKAEQDLWQAYKNHKDEIQKLIDQGCYDEASRLYHYVFAKPAHLFFEKVFVNVDNQALRNNRILLNQKINRLYTDHIADLSMIPRK